MIFGNTWTEGQPECTVPRGTFVPLMSKWHFDPQTRFVCDTRTLVLVFALRFPQEFSIKNDLDPFKRDFYWRYKCTANRGTNVPQCTAVPFKCFDPLPKIVSKHFSSFLRVCKRFLTSNHVICDFWQHLNCGSTRVYRTSRYICTADVQMTIWPTNQVCSWH